MAGSISDANAHHQAGRLAEAETIYLDLLRRNSNDVDALHYLGVLRMRQGRPNEAIDLLRKALPLAPRDAQIWNSLGSILKGANNLPGAEFAYQNATQLKPDYAEAWYNLANLLRVLQRNDAAARCYERVIELNPRFPGAYENVAMLLGRMGRADLAADVYRKWLAAEPENPIARHMAAAHQAAQAPERAADEFVSQLFDRMAPSFDSSLAALDYAVPGLLVAALSQVIPFAEGRLAILDGGCGTGLCGPLLRSSAQSLIGVDLSAGMLAKARERAVYDELHESELVAFMRARPDAIDVVICADTLVYFGALEDAAGAAAVALKRGGALAFNVEAEPEGSAERFRLHGHGRYSHGAQYVQDCLAGAGFKSPKIEPAVLRKEGGIDVNGYIVVATKASG
jgi:predicted TPR repeat methyltransferase